MEPLQINGVTYHGGFSFIPESKWVRIGRLLLGDDAVILDRVQDKQMRNMPAVELCRTRAIAAMEITSEQVAKSKLGAALVFGVLGAVTAKGSMERATVIVYLKSGETGYFTIGKQSVASLLGLLTPWLRGQGISIGPPLTAPTDTTAPSAPNLIADELTKLGQLRDTGVLSDEEFVALKTKLIKDHMGSGTQPQGQL